MKTYILIFSVFIFYSCQTQENDKEHIIVTEEEHEIKIFERYANFDFLNNTGVGKYSADIEYYYEKHNDTIHLITNETGRRIIFSQKDTSEYDTKLWTTAFKVSSMTTDSLYKPLFYSDMEFGIDGGIFIKDSLICCINKVIHYSDHIVVFSNELAPVFYLNIEGYGDNASVHFVAKFDNKRPFIIDSIEKPFAFIPSDINDICKKYKDTKINQDDYTFSLTGSFPDFPVWVNFNYGYQAYPTDKYSVFNPEKED